MKLLLLLSALCVGLMAQTNSNFWVGPFDCSAPACPGFGMALPLGAVVSQVTINQQQTIPWTVETVYCYGTPCSIMVDAGQGIVLGPTDQVWVTWTQGTVALKAKRPQPRRKR